MMKKLKYLLAAFAIVALGSCKKYLEENLISSLDVDQINSTATLRMALTGVYSNLQLCYNRNCMAVGELGTDIAYYPSSNESFRPVDTYALTPNTDPVTMYWRRHFGLIKDANVVIDRSAKLYAKEIISLTDHNDITAQARFLRGWAYFKLMQTFGELPLIDKYLSVIGPEEYAIPRSSIKDVFKFIEADLLFGCTSEEDEAPLLSKQKSGGLANYWAAKFFLAKLYLYVGSSKHRNAVGTPEGGVKYDRMGNWPQFPPTPINGGVVNMIPGYNGVEESYMELYIASREALDEIISSDEFELTANFWEPHAWQLKNTNSESIWEIQFADADGLGSNWSKSFGTRSSNLVEDREVSPIVGWQLIMPTPNFCKYYKPGDNRARVNFTNYNVTYSGNPVVSNWNTVAIFGYPYAMNFVNPASSASFTSNITYDPNSDDDLILEATFLQNTAAMQVGTLKYTWGTSSDPLKAAMEVKMPFTLATRLPNNVVVARYADVLLMYAETDMLIAGASPDKPRATGFATPKALEYANMLLNRGTGLTTDAEYDNLVTTTLTAYQLSLITQAADSLIQYNNYNNAANKTNALYASWQLSAHRAYSWMNKIAKLENNTPGADRWVVQPYVAESFTYEMLIDERARELCFEFHRWSDLQRLGWLRYKVYQRKNDFFTYNIPEIVEPKHYLYPLPFIDAELSTNPDFKKNNPGY